jgi:hypothetical protein
MERRRTNPKPLPEVLSTYDADEDLEPFPADFIGPKDKNKLLRLRKENNDMKRAYEMMAPKDASSSHTLASVPIQQRHYPARSTSVAYRHASTIAYDSLTTTINEEDALHEQNMAAWFLNNDALPTAIQVQSLQQTHNYH